MVHRASRRITVLASVIAFVAAGAVFAQVFAIDKTLAFALAVSSLAFVALRLPTVAWVAFAVASPWLSRLLTEHHLAPRFFDFLDFPLCAAAALTAALNYSKRLDRLARAQARILAWTAVFGGVIVASWLVAPTEPQRLAAALVFALQPFLLLVALILDPPRAKEHRALIALLAAIVLAQYPVALLQSTVETNADEIKGTLLGAGAGHHVMAGTLVIGLLVITRLGWPKTVLVACAIVTIVITVAADAKQVLFLAPVGFVVTALVPRRAAVGASNRRVLTLLLAGVAVVGLLSYSATQTAFDFIDRTRESDGGKVAVAKAVGRDTLGDPAHFALGYGPGQTVSRFAFLNTDLLERKSGNPMDILGLSTAKRSAYYDQVASEGPYIGRTSFSSPQSSLLGILGDYGLLGIAAYAMLVASVIRALWRSASPVAAGVVGSWAMAIPLGLVFDWLEQPPFMLFLALATGLALTDRGRTGDAVTVRDTTRARSAADVALVDT